MCRTVLFFRHLARNMETPTESEKSSFWGHFRETVRLTDVHNEGKSIYTPISCYQTHASKGMVQTDDEFG